MSTGPANRRVLLTVSGTIPDGVVEDAAAGRRPRPDYLVMADELPAELIDHAAARRRGGRIGRLLGRFAGANATLAWACFRERHRYDTILTDGEQVGLPLAALFLLAGRRRPRHLMIVHVMSTRSKTVLFRALGLRRRIDVLVVYATAQARYATERLRVPPERVVCTPFQVDTTFFSPDRVFAPAEPVPVVCSAGLERRDYPTLMAAARELDVQVVIAAASPWSRWPDSARTEEPPANVEVVSLDLAALRDLYARATIVVMPLQASDFQAGVTTLLEAMAMAKPIVCTRTAGQTDVLVDGETGLYVAPGDVAGLRDAVRRLLDDPALARRLGAQARQWAVVHADVVRYAAGFREHVGPA